MKISKRIRKSTKRCFTQLTKHPKKIESQLNKDLLKILHKGGTLNQAIYKTAKNPDLLSPQVRSYMKKKLDKMQKCVNRVLAKK